MKTPKLVFSDFDGTLTLEDELRPEFFQVLDLLRSKDIPLVICTGRSKSWAHFLLSHFPDLNYVITEGGGVLTKVEMLGQRRVMKDVVLVDEQEVVRLEKVVRDLKQRFKKIELSVDSYGRQTDRAIELSFFEDHPEMKAQVCSFFDEQGVNYSISNVHMNFWCGEISKIKSIRHFLRSYIHHSEEEVLFFGDSLNDESVFENLHHCVGVSNIENVKDRLKFLPEVILEGKRNKGILGVLNYLKLILDNH